ncbi:hypothetical protein E4T54_11910 (plasmid) [Legionella geestiana]|nr:hypothetical protein E4T54_11910 [Legionella geestiana]STX59187.1 Uncharacterised protein [Legionella geestiana]
MNGTRQALVLWENVRPEYRIMILNNVWCGQCGKGVGIANPYATVLKGDILLDGTCVTCGSKVARYLEMQT